MTTDWVKEVFNKYLYIEQIAYSGESDTLIKECQEYLGLYQALCAEVLELRKPFLSELIKIAEDIYYTRTSDYEKKLRSKSYYRANCSAFNVVFQRILSRLQNQNIQESASRKLRGLILKYITDSLRLLNHYQHSTGNDSLFRASLTSNPDYRLYFDTCEQIVFGEVRFDDYSDQSEVTPALIRVMIELRLKWSMGISGYLVSQKPGASQKLGNMSDFLEVYRHFVNSRKIDTAPKFDVIKKIYEWGNIYIHTGTRSYIWFTGLAINLLAPLFYGEDHNLSGVRVESLATIYEFWDKLKSHYNQDHKEADITIVPYSPGFICTDKNCNPIPCRNHYAIYENLLSECSDQAVAAYNMKCILDEGSRVIGNVLYERVKHSYICLREKEIGERAYYLWLQRGMGLWEADADWYTAIEEDISFLPKPENQ